MRGNENKIHIFREFELEDLGHKRSSICICIQCRNHYLYEPLDSITTILVSRTPKLVMIMILSFLEFHPQHLTQ